MKRSTCSFAFLLSLLLGSQPCHAERIKAYVNSFAAAVTENREELKASLQTLLMSRLNGDEIQAVDNKAEAEIQIFGSYIAFGTVFSLDALVKTSSGVFVDRVFVQNEGAKELIPAVGEMARLLRRVILSRKPDMAVKPAAASVPLPVEKAPAPASVLTEERLPVVAEKAPPVVARQVEATPPVVEPVPVKPAGQLSEKLLPYTERSPVVETTPPVAEKIPVITAKREARPETEPAKAADQAKLPEKSWISHQLPESLNGVALGRTLKDKGVEVFITGERYLRYYLKTRNMQFLSAVAFESDEKIIGVDVADLDQSEVPEIFVTLLKGGVPASRVYIPENNQLKKIADNIPYLLRGVAFEGGEKKIFAQKADSDGNLIGDVYELAKKGNSFTAEAPLALPLFANLYNFNRFADTKGKLFYVVGHPDGYLLVYSNEKKQLWKSRDKFGGSEALLCQAENSDPASPAKMPCKAYLPQRLLVTRTGEVLVPRNTGLTANGTTRNYSKNNIMQLAWDGSSLKEKWRTELSQNYLADFSYDDHARELLLLEVEPKIDSSEERSSKVVVRKID